MQEPLTGNSRALRKNQTEAEFALWRKLRNRRIDGWKFKRQAPCGPYIADFLCIDASLIIEVDGGQHAEEKLEYDLKRTAFLEAQGLRVLRFWNGDVLTNIQGVLEAIYLALGQKPAPSPGAFRALSAREHRPLPKGRGLTARGGDEIQISGASDAFVAFNASPDQNNKKLAHLPLPTGERVGVRGLSQQPSFEKAPSPDTSRRPLPEGRGVTASGEGDAQSSSIDGGCE